MVELTNYYQLLNIDRSADLNTIKKAFRTEIALYHPDNNSSKGARARFDLLVEGFDILSHPKKRETYDAMLRDSDFNKPVIIKRKVEPEYQEWQKEAKKKSDSYWDSSLAEVLVLDIFLEAGFSGLFSGTEDLLDSLGDSLGDILDIDIF
ncbi:DnaJ domain-containing protein [uncultured Psychroserpens sp.]|uniref:J domain-containing protein n=1 Tax=uncultured Psychroserpens sp. TaxID=255436 RepID=UPI00263333E5|nr:DnaJ domain-containing protein [uncultured Psychroserpens sp.]